jgi:ribulose-bisphosphate carboxylase small chain
MARITQGCFSLLPDLTNEQIKKQIQYCINNKYAVSIEWTDDPHPRNCYWEMWDYHYSMYLMLQQSCTN